MIDQSTEEQSRLDQAMQRADDMLVSSLRRDDALRKYRVIIGSLVVLVLLLATALVVVLATRPAQKLVATGTEAVDPLVLTQEGWQLWQQRRLGEAESKFNEAVKADPKQPDAWNGLGWSRFNAGKTDKAIEAFNKCVELDPNHPAALNGLGQAYYAKNQFDKAEPFLLKAAERKASAAWWGLARIYLLQEKWADAEKWAGKIVDSGENSGQPLLDAAKAKKLPDALRDTIAPAAK